MRRLVGVALLALAGSGCTSVKLMQRDGCWIKHSENIFGRVREEIGPCARAQPKWVEDRLTRLVQECVAQADYRWQVRALESWMRKNPYPAQPPQQEILHTCMEEARVGLVTENETLKARLAEMASDRDTYRSDVERDRVHLRGSHDKLAEWLGQAAQKPAGTATATATSTSDGSASNESGAHLTSESGSESGASAPPGNSTTLARTSGDGARAGDRPKPTSASAAKATPSSVQLRARRTPPVVPASGGGACSAPCDGGPLPVKTEPPAP